MKNTVLFTFLKEYKDYFVETDHSTNSADSYCTYLRKACVFLNLGEGFLEAISTIVDVKVRAALCEYLMAKLSEAFEKETDKTIKKQISNYKSAVSMLSEFVARDDASEVESVADEAPSLTVALPHASEYTQKELLNKFHNRLSTQDRFYSEACFPARIITKINAGRKKLYDNLSLNTRFLIAANPDKYLLLREIDRLIIQTDGYVKIEGKGKLHDVYTAVYEKGALVGYERFCVDSVELISLDHNLPMHSELKSFLAAHAVYRAFSDSVREHKSKHPEIKGVSARATDYFKNVYPTFKVNEKLDENILLDEICAFIDSLQLVVLHRSYNSSKSDN